LLGHMLLNLMFSVKSIDVRTVDVRTNGIRLNVITTNVIKIIVALPYAVKSNVKCQKDS
jgi:hypothetical protein